MSRLMKTPLSRLTHLSLCVLFFSAAAIGADCEQRNVLLIAIDDMNDRVGCLGGCANTHTPNIDRLAARTWRPR